jgi:hypothetical protein
LRIQDIKIQRLELVCAAHRRKIARIQTFSTVTDPPNERANSAPIEREITALRPKIEACSAALSYIGDPTTGY